MTARLQVNEAVLRKVVEWCEHHRNDPVTAPDDESDARKKTTDIEEWDQKFMQVDQEMLFEIILVRDHSSLNSNVVFATNHSPRPPISWISSPFSMLAARPWPT